MADKLKAPAPLDRAHELDEFDCGVPALNEFLQRHAWGYSNKGTYTLIGSAEILKL